jgi:type II restriction/modification system DNA methylase subunit YeeA
MDNISTAERILTEMLKNNFQTKELFLYKLFFGEVLREGGFDIVIGNPPYIRQEKIKELKPKLEIEKYQSYNGTADIYIYFFEQGYRLLKEDGVLSFITSNKYTRAKYGREFRDFLLKNTQLLEYIDFNGVKVFESATVDTSILTFKKTKKSSDFLYCDIGTDYKGGELKSYCDKNGFGYSQSDLSAESFTFASPKELRIKKRIEEIGTPLKEWDVKINYGIKTGFNEAFIIDTAKRNELIAKDPKSAEIIKPILRGRDIKRYGYEWAGLWLINSHNNPPVNINEYPAIKEHLDEYYPQLEKRFDQGVTPYNLRNCAYLDEFEKEKITWTELVDNGRFCIVEAGIYCEATTFVMSTNYNKYLVSMLNSKLVSWYFGTICAKLGEGANRWKKQYVELLPIPKIPESDQKPFEILVDYIIFAKANALDTEANFFESVIDVMVYGLYFEESMKKADCFINDEVKLLLENCADIKEAYKVFKESKTVMRGLTYSRTVEEVKIISGAKDD